ncbi:hypothetical protein PRZ48_005266 [Zasmidium cellare]|uniref:SprT-like domain-containing protein n=1 Tax=Zasmidium cellare TaxID=395010 RepID=A0ABR0ESA3_ZASCE|nr:hypothetical protein PRZ48_005266 [Zasmidium cellare]
MSLPTEEDLKRYDPIKADITVVLETPHEQDTESKRVFEEKVRHVASFRKHLEGMEDYSTIARDDYCGVLSALDYLCFCGEIFRPAPIYSNMLPLTFKIISDPDSTTMARTWIEGSRYVLGINVAKHDTPLMLIGTLLHEMSHMLIHKLRRQEQIEGRPMLEYLFGATGHGYYWQRLARVVEARAYEIIDRRIDVGRLEAISHEREASGIVPSQAYYEMCYGGWESSDGKPMAEVASEYVESCHNVRLNKEALQEMAFPNGGE